MGAEVGSRGMGQGVQTKSGSRAEEEREGAECGSRGWAIRESEQRVGARDGNLRWKRVKGRSRIWDRGWEQGGTE
jgi:hypothetical protein